MDFSVIIEEKDTMCIAECDNLKCPIHIRKIADIDDPLDVYQKDLSDICPNYMPTEEGMGDC